MSNTTYNPLIENYDYEQRKFFRTQCGIFKTFANDFNLNYWDNMDINLYKCVKMFGFGDLQDMKGKICCHKEDLDKIHDYFKNLFVKGKLFGNIAISRPTLPYQHFVLDFDLKHIKCCSYKKLNNEDYNTYIRNRDCSEERYLMNNENFTNSINYNTNSFIYEIIYYLTQLLKLNWLPIYIMGKNGSFDKGFHIEIPNLIMSYHDIALLSFSCTKFIPNKKILDSPNNYSIFGCQKIFINDTSTFEFEMTYLPYVVYCDNNFLYDKTFSTLEQAFDTFNIIKHLNNENIYGFKIFTNFDEINYDDDVLYNLLFNNDINEKDNTVPEYIKMTFNNNNNDNRNISNQIMNILKTTTTTETTNKSMIYPIGYIQCQSYLQYTDNIKLYKNLLLDKDKDFIKYENIEKTLYDFSYKEDLSLLKLNILEIPKYYSQNNIWSMDVKKNFGNKSLPFYNIDIYVENDDHEIDDKFQSFLYPFFIEHLLKLTFGNFHKRLLNTIFYLVSIYMLSEKIRPINYFMKKWLHDLGIKQLLNQFLDIFFILKSKIDDGSVKLDLTDQNWVILYLKSLLIKYNILSFNEINNDKKIISYTNKKKINVGALRTIEIPDILLFSIFHDPTRLYELIALYCPIIRKDINKDKQKYSSIDNNNDINYILWDNNKKEWINIGVINNNNLKNFFLISPELYYIAQIITSSSKTNKENDNDEDDGNQKKSVKNITIITCLNEIINKILIFWQDFNFKPIPKYLWKMNDCYFLLGGKDNKNNNLIDILPLPMYNDNENNDNNNFNSNEIKQLVHHIMNCDFIQKQFFPIIREIFKDNDIMKKRKRDDDDDDKALRKIINSRDNFTNSRSVDEEIYMEIHKGICNHENISSFSSSDIINRIWGYKLKLMNMTRDQYHYEMVNNSDNNETMKEIIKLVKYFVIDRMSICYKDMKNAQVSQDILINYAKGVYNNNKEKKIKDIAHCLYKVLYSDPHSAQLSDIEPDEMTKIECDCLIAKTFLYLLQTFSYDISAIRFILSQIILAIIYGPDLQQKILHIFLGNTNSGKTRFLKSIIQVLGNKAGIISSRTSYYGTHQDRTHDIGKKADSARLWYIDEIGNKDYNKEFFNQLTGNSPLFIRTNYTSGRMIKVAPTVFIFGNNAPKFTENCPALIGRLKFFTFRSEFDSAVPVCFKYCKFPQISDFDKTQNDLSKGLMAILLHAICFSNVNSPFYLHKVVVDIPKNIQDSTIMYSPVINIVKDLIQNCDLIENSEGIITVKRIVFLINNLKDVLKSIKVSTASDAVRFLDQIYPKSKIANNNIACDESHKDIEKGGFTLVYQGLIERDVEANDQKILMAHKKKN